MKYKNFREYYDIRQNEGIIGKTIGTIAGAVGPAALAGAASAGILDPSDAGTWHSIGHAPGVMAGLMGGAILGLPSKIGNIFSELGDKVRRWFGLGKPKDKQATTYVGSLERKLTNPYAAAFAENMEKLNTLMPGIPTLGKVPVAKRELVFRTWLSREPIFNNIGRLREALQLCQEALDYAKKLNFTPATENLTVIVPAIQGAIEHLERTDKPQFTPFERSPRTPDFPEPTDDPELSKSAREAYILKAIRFGYSVDQIIQGLKDKYGVKSDRNAKALITKVRNTSNRWYADDEARSAADET